jgi:hypothetical protein
MGKSFSMKENGPLYSGSSDELIDLGLANYMWLQRVAQRATPRGCETNDVDPRPYRNRSRRAVGGDRRNGS